MPRIPLNDGEHIIIDVPRDEPSRSQSPERRKGIVRPRDHSQELGRRRLKKEGLIRFFDLGYIIGVGDVYASSIPTFDPVNGLSGTGLDQTDIDAKYFDLRDQILAIPEADIFTSFTHLTKTHPVIANSYLEYVSDTLGYVNDVPANITAFSTEGLKLSPSEAVTLNLGNSYFLSRSPMDDEDGLWKITNEPSFGADAVSFTKSNNMDVAISPTFAYQGAGVSYSRDEALNQFIATLPRASAPWDSSGSSYAVRYDLWRIMRASPDARAAEETALVWTLISPASFAPAGTFPPPPAEPVAAIYDAAIFDAIFDFGSGVQAPIGTLQLIIRQNGQYFYFWKAALV